MTAWIHATAAALFGLLALGSALARGTRPPTRPRSGN